MFVGDVDRILIKREQTKSKQHTPPRTAAFRFARQVSGADPALDPCVEAAQIDQASPAPLVRTPAHIGCADVSFLGGRPKKGSG
jgi:hypothetical protein